MTSRNFKPSSSHFETFVSVVDQIRVPFRPRCLPSQKLAEEIESCKRKIWECVGPVERQRHIEKKQKIQQIRVAENKENANVLVEKSGKSISESIAQETKNISVVNQPQKSLASRSNIEFKVNAMKVVELRKELKNRGYETSGLKKDLRIRLLDAMLVELEAEGSMQIPLAPKPLVKPLQAQEQPVSSTKAEITTSKDDNKTDEEVNLDKIDNNTRMSIIDSNHEPPQKMSIEPPSKESSKMSIEPQGMEQLQIERKSHDRESISSMQVEHHNTTVQEPPNVKSENAPQKETQKATEAVMKEAMVRSPAPREIQPPLSNAKKVSTESSPEGFKGVLEAKKFFSSAKKFQNIGSAVKISKPITSSNETGDDTTPPASETSSTISKNSGRMVQEMVSKFSGQVSLSSTMTSSSMKKIKDSRMAKIAEMREKSKTTSATNIGSSSKIHTQSSTTVNKAPTTTGSTLKDKLAAQMRQKAAANQQSAKKLFLGSTSKLAQPPTNKSHIQFSAGVQDPLASTLKQHYIKPKPQSPMDTYEISDREETDSEADEDSDSEVESDKQQKKIPTWAVRANLMKALEQQYNGRVDGKRVDPDDIFPEVQSCDLVAIFGTKKADKYRSRNSSGNWLRDKVTAAEKLVYKREMGFAHPSSGREGP